MKTTSVIIVENNTDFRDTLRNAFEIRGYVTWTFPTIEIAASIFSTIQPTVIVLDLDTYGSEAFEMIAACKEQCPHTSVIVESGKADALRQEKAFNHGAHAFLVKPYALPPLFELLDKMAPEARPSVNPMPQAA